MSFEKIDLSREKTWVTAGGEVIEIEHLSNDHLINTILYLERNIEGIKLQHDLQLLNYLPNGAGLEYEWNNPSMPKHGSLRHRSIQSAIEEMWNMDPMGWLKKTNTYIHLMWEIYKRRLEPFLEQARNRR